jgi:hypothetical protein
MKIRRGLAADAADRRLPVGVSEKAPTGAFIDSQRERWRLPEKQPDRFNRRCLLPFKCDEASVHDSYMRVRLSQAAHVELLRAIRQPVEAGVECACLLLGTFEHGLFGVRHSPIADKPQRRRPQRAELDLARCDELERKYQGTADVLGNLHIHVHERGVPYPSPADLRSWRSWLDHFAVDRHLGVIVHRGLVGGWDRPRATGFVMTRSKSGRLDMETVPVELPATYLLREAAEPQQLIAVADRTAPALDGGESTFFRGYTCWSDHPDAVDFPSAFVPATSLDAPSRAVKRTLGTKLLPGGWVRYSRRLPVGEDIWWERNHGDGRVETSYVVPDEIVAAGLA